MGNVTERDAFPANVDAAHTVPSLWRVLFGYSAMLVIGGLLFLLICHVQGQLVSASITRTSVFSRPGSSVPEALRNLLLALTVIIIVARATGKVFRRIHQPPVVGEIMAGILLGPSLLGRFAPGATRFLFPDSIFPALSTIAQIGVIFYMFIIGMELDITRFRERMHTTLVISHASIVCPFLLGSMLALFLYPRFSAANASFIAFALFMGVSMSITAFPVLARILTDRRLHRSHLGRMALTCAAVNDVSAWCLLAFVVGVIQVHLDRAVVTTTLTVAYIAAMLFIVRPSLLHFVRKHQEAAVSDQHVMVVMAISLLLSCLVTEAIGIHSLFGAFLIGVILPSNSSVTRMLIEKLNDFVVVLLLPSFFALTGLRTQVGLISGMGWLICFGVVLVAFAGKFGGTTIAARLTGMRWRDASALGILMNTRGLVELIVLNIGLDLGIISPQLFAMMVIMAVATTFATSPILDRLLSLDGDSDNLKTPYPADDSQVTR